MALAILILLSLLILLTLQNQRAKVRKCQSMSCGHNIKGRCKLIEIDIYDNGALGICLWHTSSMDKRVLEPYKQGREIGKKDGEIKILDNLIKGMEDNQAVKDPKRFAEWMKKHLKDQK